MKIIRNKQLLKTFLLSSILVVNILYFSPFTLYVGNIDEFVYPASSFFNLFTVFALLILVLLLIAGMLFNRKTSDRYHVFIAAVGLLVWFQGNVLVWEYGLLDGKNINWNKDVWRGWVDAGIWVIIITASIVFYRRVGNKLIQLVAILFILQTLTIGYLFYENIDRLSAKADSNNKAIDLDNIHAFSPDHNVLHIILDSFQADIFNEIINNSGSNNDYYEALQGFVFFKEHMGVFPTTYMSVPVLLGGEIYKNHMPKKEFVRNVMSGKSILNVVFAAGYEVDIASNAFLTGLYTEGLHTNSYIIPKNYLTSVQVSYIDEALKLLDLSIFRLAPHFLKKHIYNDQRWFFQSILNDNQQPMFDYYSHNTFLSDFRSKMSLNRKKPTYKFFHLMSTHWPFVIDGSDGNCHYAGGPLPIKRDAATWQMRCTLDVVISLFDKMKELGIYDNSLIIIMGDHGAQITPLRFGSKIETDDKYQFNLDAWIMAQVTPLMLIKSPHNAGPLKVSNAPTSMLDTAETINSILNLNQDYAGQSMFELDPTKDRVRRHYFYHWTREDWVTDYTAPIQEFIVRGSIYDMETWRQGEEYHSPLNRDTAQIK